jgi:uncharacterized membrane protein YtjA (UPF0391 family)
MGWGAACLELGEERAPAGRVGNAYGSHAGKENTMLKWAIIFAVVALVAGLLGFTGIAGAAAGVAKILFFLFLAVVAFFVIAGLFAGRKITGG